MNNMAHCNWCQGSSLREIYDSEHLNSNSIKEGSAFRSWANILGFGDSLFGGGGGGGHDKNSHHNLTDHHRGSHGYRISLALNKVQDINFLPNTLNSTEKKSTGLYFVRVITGGT